MTDGKAGYQSGSGAAAAEAIVSERLDRALLEAPAISVPPTFAAEVLRRVAQEPATAPVWRQTSFGQWAMAGCGAALFAAVLWLSPAVARMTPHSLLFESVLAMEFAVVVVSVGPWRLGRGSGL